MSPIRDVQESPRAWTESRWARATERELLIDPAEWAGAARCERPASYRCGITSGLWTLLEARATSAPAVLRSRIRPLVRAAERILRPLSAAGLGAPGIVADFALLLPSRSGAPSGCSLRLHAERSPDGALFVSIGLRTDFSAHPLERTASEPSCDSLRGEPTHRSGASLPHPPPHGQPGLASRAPFWVARPASVTPRLHGVLKGPQEFTRRPIPFLRWAIRVIR